MESEARIIYSEYYLVPEKLYALIGKNIKRLRKEHGMTQEQLAEQTDTDQKQISKIESGRIHTKLTTYLRIANVFGVSIDHFLADAFMIEPEHYPASMISGEDEQEFLHEVIHAALRYLEQK